MKVICREVKLPQDQWFQNLSPFLEVIVNCDLVGVAAGELLRELKDMALGDIGFQWGNLLSTAASAAADELLVCGWEGFGLFKLNREEGC